MTAKDIADEWFPYLTKVEAQTVFPAVQQGCQTVVLLCGTRRDAP